jgi:catechol 2,3-dioxygenase-like lactoylglutathione lyase family enzyme
MNPSIKLQGVVLDCPEPAKLAKFYMDLLGGKITCYSHEETDYFVLVAIPGENITISCQLNEDYVPPVWPGSRQEHQPMEHLDFIVEDMAASVQYALSLGATKPSAQYWQPGWGPQWVTLLDPAGHPFCLCAKEDGKE